MKFYDVTKLLYLETYVSGVGLGAALLQAGSGTSCPRDNAPDNSILRPITFASKSLSSAERRYRNIKRDALGILHRLEKFCHYCFAREVSIITDHKTLVAISRKTLQHYHREYNEFCSGYANTESESYTDHEQICSLQTCSPERTTQKTRIQKYLACNGILIAIQTTTNIPDYITIQQSQQATSQDDDLQQLKEYIIRGWPETRYHTAYKHTGHFEMTWSD